MSFQLIVLEDGVFPETGEPGFFYLDKPMKKYFIYTTKGWKNYPMIGVI